MPVINEVIANQPGSRPVLVDFQNGKIQPGEEKNLKSALYRRQKETVVSVNSGKITYAGTVDKNDLYNNFIVIHDKKNNKVRLVQVDYCTVSPLFEKRNSVLTSPSSKSENTVSELRKRFGSKKSKKQTEQQERLKMNIDTVKEQLEKTISDVRIDKADMNVVPDENDNLYRPRINRDASTREQVYNLDDLVPLSVLESLSDEAFSITEGDGMEQYSLGSLASAGISQLLTSPDDGDKALKISIYLYIDYLIKFMNLPMKQVTKKFVVCDKSAEVNKHIMDNFIVATAGKWLRPMYLKDKTLCFVLVLAALASNYKVDVEAVSKDLKISSKKCLEISRILAFSSTKQKNVVCLKLPLPEPVAAFSKRRRH